MDLSSALVERVDAVFADMEASGLRPANVIAGEPPIKLADRMNEFHVPGVSIAVIHGGVIYTRGFGVVRLMQQATGTALPHD